MSKTVDPFFITGPAIISFSGGRTSGYMLWRILQAHGGTLPEGVTVAFANTGKEREETLRFVHDCGTHWNVPIMWLEYRAPKSFEVVGYNSASRNGEPFADLIRQKKYTPAPVRRFCTEVLKVQVIHDYMRSIGHSSWVNIIGLRHDEGARVLRALERNDTGQRPDISVMPLAKAKITKRDVMQFWSSQSFDLQLEPWEGNCDLCFLKSKKTLRETIRRKPSLADWWIEMEKVGKGTFRSDSSYQSLVDDVATQPMFDLIEVGHEEECIMSCGAGQDDG